MLLICGMKNSHAPISTKPMRNTSEGSKQPSKVLLCKKSLLKNLANLTGKHLCWSLFNKITGLKVCNFI